MTEVMNPEVRRRWQAALRSGNYAQGRGLLHYVDDGEDKFCCLGVLCELAVVDGVVERIRSSSLVFSYGLADDVLHDGTLPDEVVFWAGLRDVDPHVGPTTLSGWNDGVESLGIQPRTFAEIADLLEEL